MNKFYVVISFLVFGLTGNSVSYGADPDFHYFSDYFALKNVQIDEIDKIQDSHNLFLDAISVTTDANVALDNVINIGKKVWSLIEANKAVVNFSSASANAIPAGLEHWEQMQEWKTPNSRLFRVTYSNFLGMKVVDFTFRLIYTYGGTVNGKGLYLTQIEVIPAELLVRSGYSFDVHVSVPGVTNAGTSESPIAAAEILVSWSLDNWARHIEGSQSYYIRGDGYFENMSGKLEIPPTKTEETEEESSPVYPESDEEKIELDPSEGFIRKI